MVASVKANAKNLTPLQQRLIAGLETLPFDISLCLLDGKKAPLGKGWQNNPFTKAQVADAIVNGITLRNGEGKEFRLKAAKIKGYGILTGTELTRNGERYYVIALDNDGPSAGGKVTELSGGIGLPKTVRFTSGREGRFQSLFLIPEAFAASIQTKKLPTQPKTETQDLEQLEFRWTGHQSCLPPSVHPSTGKYVYVDGCAFGEVEIAIAPDWVIEQMLTDKSTPNPTSTVEAKQKPMQTTQPMPQWTDRDWALSYLAALSPSRADSYQDWLSVGMALHSVEDDSLLHDWDAWSRASTKYKPGECDKKWASFGKRSGIKLGTLGQMAKEDGWQSPKKASGRNYTGGIGSSSGGIGGNGGNRRGTGGSGGDGGDGGDGNDNGKVVRFPHVHVLSDAELEAEVDQLINQGVSGSRLTSKLNRLAAASQIYVGELRKLYYERLSESDLNLERDAHQGEIENLLKLSEAKLDLNDYLPPVLAEPITLWCEWLAIRPAVALTAMLAGVSSLHRVGTELVLHRNLNFRVPPTVYAALVSPSGQKKSPVFSNLIRQPLNQLSDEKEDAYNAAVEDYEAALQAWEQNDKKGGKPEKPKEPTLYYFTNATGEAIPAQASKAPDKALLALIDELSGLFNSENAYRKGRGSDKQDLLSYFDGMGQTVLRASGVKVKLTRLNLSMFGTIQPEILRNHMEDCSDPDGQWARFLFVNQPLSASALPDLDGESVQIHERLADFYRQIERIPEMEYRLSRAAFKRYQPVFDELERLRVTHTKPGMRAVFAKMEGYIGRLALNLHVLWEIAAGKVIPDEEIPLSIMEMAIKLAKFYFGQVKLLHANADDAALPTQILKLIELSKRWEANGKDGWVKAQALVEQFSRKKRPKAQQAREWMLEAVMMGLGRTRGSGNRLEFHWRGGDNEENAPSTAPNSGTGRNNGTEYPEPESVENKGVNANFGNFGKGFQHPSQQKVEVCFRQNEPDNVDVDAKAPKSEPIPPEPPPSCGDPKTQISLNKAARKSSRSDRKNVDAANDTNFGKGEAEAVQKSSLTEAVTEPAAAKNAPEPRRMTLRNKKVRIYAKGGYPEAVGVVLQGDTFPGPIVVRVLGGDFSGKEWIVGENDYELIEEKKGFGRK